MVDADIRDVDALMASDGVRSLIDLSQPVGVLFAGVLHSSPTTTTLRAS